MRFLLILLFIAPLVTSCAPVPNSEPDNTSTAFTPQYLGNVSTIYGAGAKIAKDKSGLYVASNITWKDSLGALHSLDELRGNVIVLNFWATWCQYCQKELPDLQAISEEYADQNVVVIGVSVDKKINDFEAFEQAQFFADSTVKVKFQIVVDPPATSYFNYGASSTLPWSFIIDAGGHIRTTFQGEPTKKQLMDAIEQIL
ncbi:MAG: TlpA disulfide reductase family protein [Ignavibacteriota bacterium]